jgi:hypothetical protein
VESAEDAYFSHSGKMICNLKNSQEELLRDHLAERGMLRKVTPTTLFSIWAIYLEGLVLF